jgi:hypothetical protein
MPDEANWVVWSEERGLWRLPEETPGGGYINSIVAAGRFPKDVAKRIERNANYRAALPQEIALPDPLAGPEWSIPNG